MKNAGRDCREGRRGENLHEPLDRGSSDAYLPIMEATMNTNRTDDHDHACRGCGEGIFCNATTDAGCAAIFDGYCSDCNAELAAEDAMLREADRVNGYINDGFGGN
jgi:hypothetical protein